MRKRPHFGRRLKRATEEPKSRYRYSIQADANGKPYQHVGPGRKGPYQAKPAKELYRNLLAIKDVLDRMRKTQRLRPLTDDEIEERVLLNQMRDDIQEKYLLAQLKAGVSDIELP